MAGKRISPADVTEWLMRETPEHMALMSKLRERLAATMTIDVNEHGTPTRDWARILSRYQGTYQMLMLEDRERLKLRLLMAKEGDGILTDEEYDQELKSLAVESLGTLPADALQRELERRQALGPVVEEGEEDE
jgi:hypothetical protein